MKNQETAKATVRPLISFDGCGFNDANNEYRERIATLSNYGKEMPKEYHEFIIKAVNNHEVLLEACRSAKLAMETSGLASGYGAKVYDRICQAIANATK